MADFSRTVAKRSATEWDLIEIPVSIGRTSPADVDRFFDSAEAAFERLAEWPELGRLHELHGRFKLDLRKWSIPGFPRYLIFYSATQSGIVIHRVLHGARDLAPLLEGLEE